MTLEEVKGFVKERFEHQMRNSGLADISTYMERFDSLYEQNRMDNLMPTANQRRITEVVPVAEWENPYVALREPEELAVSIADRYISIQTCTDGYDYSIYDEGYRLLDGGIYDNPDISNREALHEIITDVKETMLDSQAGAYFQEDEAAAIDYDELQEKVELREQEEIAERVGNRTEQESVAEAFRVKTLEHFKPLGNQALDDVEKTAYAHIQSVIDANELDASVVDVVVSGSRCRGLEQAGSDLDIVVEYKGFIREDGLMIACVKVDINPITEERTGGRCQTGNGVVKAPGGL